MFTEKWGFTSKKELVHRYILQNQNGMQVKIISYGAVINEILVPDRSGNVKDVVLGYDTIEEYEKGDSCFGALVGINANRISGAECNIEGISYKLEENQPGYNLHSGSNNLTVKVWSELERTSELYKEICDTSALKNNNAQADSITLYYRSSDMEEGYPGNMDIVVRYTLSQDNRLSIEYFAKTDKTTLINITNHSYFNLAGHDSNTIAEHMLMIPAKQFVPVKEGSFLPVGKLMSVENTPMDFQVDKEIVKDISSDYNQIKQSNGYDHCYVLDESNVLGELKLAASAECKNTGIIMKTYTDCPGIQLYTANGLNEEKGKKGCIYKRQSAFCLETEFFPDSINQSEFASPLIYPDKNYYSRTDYVFENN